MLLAQQGRAGRAEANRILWELLAVTAPRGLECNDSAWISKQAAYARRIIDRPRWNHEDFLEWPKGKSIATWLSGY